ncbi:MAG: T9SS type A sorting domain-containing protein [Bacteroidia bacterium]|jgi:hypothetical protein
MKWKVILFLLSAFSGKILNAQALQNSYLKGTPKYYKTRCPRPAFRLISHANNDTICSGTKVSIINLADSIGQTDPSDTPTRKTIIDWGDGAFSVVIGRRDTAHHSYGIGTATNYLTVIGLDEDPMTGVSTCLPVFFPDTMIGQQVIRLHVLAVESVNIFGKRFAPLNDTCDYYVTNEVGITYQWSIDKGVLLSRTDSNVVKVRLPEENTTCTIRVEKTNNKGCSGTDALNITVGTTGIEDDKELESAMVYPNPATHNIYFSINLKYATKIKVIIYDILGQEVSIQSFSLPAGESTRSVVLEKALSGMYFMKLETKEEEKVIKFFVD